MSHSSPPDFSHTVPSGDPLGVAVQRPVVQGPVIGAFDSGFGGLTVLRALLPLIPGAHYIYLGDTARLPYGSKSPQTIARYATAAARFLESKGADLIVIACNTASALAMDALQATANVPVIGVIDPGAASAAQTAQQGDILVLATSATVQSHAYARACARYGLNAIEKACPLLVPLVEEGWTDHPVTAEILNIYLTEALAEAAADGQQPRTVLLGCTHYLLLRPMIERTLAALSPGQPMAIIDSAEATAQRVAKALPPLHIHTPAAEATCSFFATDSVDRFRTLGARFLGRPIAHVEHIDLGG